MSQDNPLERMRWAAFRRRLLEFQRDTIDGVPDGDLVDRMIEDLDAILDFKVEAALSKVRQQPPHYDA